MVICGQCNKEFDTAEEELDHICEVTGVKPTEPQSMGPNYKQIQEAALARGEEDQANAKSTTKSKSK